VRHGRRCTRRPFRCRVPTTRSSTLDCSTDSRPSGWRARRCTDNPRTAARPTDPRTPPRAAARVCPAATDHRDRGRRCRPPGRWRLWRTDRGSGWRSRRPSMAEPRQADDCGNQRHGDERGGRRPQSAGPAFAIDGVARCRRSTGRQRRLRRRGRLRKNDDAVGRWRQRPFGADRLEFDIRPRARVRRRRRRPGANALPQSLEGFIETLLSPMASLRGGSVHRSGWTRGDRSRRRQSRSVCAAEHRTWQQNDYQPEHVAPVAQNHRRSATQTAGQPRQREPASRSAVGLAADELDLRWRRMPPLVVRVVFSPSSPAAGCRLPPGRFL
jgi:hypothetical protein